jgi:hypothetical protein
MSQIAVVALASAQTFDFATVRRAERHATRRSPAARSSLSPGRSVEVRFLGDLVVRSPSPPIRTKLEWRKIEGLIDRAWAGR